LQDIYQTVADPGLHAAAEWLLRRWQQEKWLRQVNDRWAKEKEGLEAIQQSITKNKGNVSPDWYVNGQGQTMIVIPGPVEFVMGSPPTEKRRSATENQHRTQIGRTFAICSTPVTKEQFLRFLPEFHHTEMSHYPDPACPIGGVDWYEAAAYCNWLSKQEAIPEAQWCYETNAEGQVVKLKEKYLRLTGYRLPTESEWEYACRAGTVTSRHYGQSEELLTHYGWYLENAGERTWPVGRKKPNDLGLHEMHGNVFNWCQEKYEAYPEWKEGMVYDDNEDTLPVNKEDSRVLRGGSFDFSAGYIRSARREWYIPAYRFSWAGLRVARTLAAP
jgi:formylglycine-generating enzyme required for sulfatase activity